MSVLGMVLVHAGMLETDAPEARQRRRDGMARLAEQPNVVVKLSGQGTFLHRVDPAFIAGVAHDCLALFGAERCMFGSNLPVEQIWTAFGPLLAAWQVAFPGEPADVRADVFRDTARRVYHI